MREIRSAALRPDSASRTECRETFCSRHSSALLAPVCQRPVLLPPPPSPLSSAALHGPFVFPFEANPSPHRHGPSPATGPSFLFLSPPSLPFISAFSSAGRRSSSGLSRSWLLHVAQSSNGVSRVAGPQIQ